MNGLATSLILPSAGVNVSKSNVDLASGAPSGLLRSMNRAGLLLAEAALALPQDILELIRDHGSRVAMYCAVEPSTVSHAEILKYVRDASPASYARLLPPKWGLQCSLGLAAAASTVLLGVEGGVHTFNHPVLACQNALDMARLDLAENVIDYALIGAVSSLEDPLMVQRWENDYPGIQLIEGAATVVISRDSLFEPELSQPSPGGEYFGVAHPLISSLMEMAR